MKYYVTRLLRSFLTLIIVVTIVFLLMRMMPIEGYFGASFDKLDEGQKIAKLQNLGLLDPWYIQLKNFYGDLLQGDLGESITYRPKVAISSILGDKIITSVRFGLASLGVSIVVGLSMGILMARYKGKAWDKFGTVYVVGANAVPAVIYFLLIQVFLTDLFKLPLLYDKLDPKSWILPILCLSIVNIAYYAMWIRRYMVDELNKDYVKLARAKGLKSKDIMVKHILRNAFVPLAQYLPASILYAVSGSIYVESLFSIPGTGGLLVTAIQRQDNTLVQALVLMYSSIGIIGLMLGDILMGIFDPRIKLGSKGGSR
ncbi:ABC transporter permease [Sedimentibacter sp. MB31-C6]|uniref:ABC transporter permease n=1 Tax=Sedimentibacter sp. MB31-C6 TaxID=3109366 RepID=UPI002DDDA182|nr:ABC transporter permease [Sedimentibacter sp. MB36-C1]WSI05497.1 ABC transporter permease [Sedimentibacter sp. MB36-C1]